MGEWRYWTIRFHPKRITKINKLLQKESTLKPTNYLYICSSVVPILSIFNFFSFLFSESGIFSLFLGFLWWPALLLVSLLSLSFFSSCSLFVLQHYTFGRHPLCFCMSEKMESQCYVNITSCMECDQGFR